MKSSQKKTSFLTASAAMFQVICRVQDGKIRGQIFNACYEAPVPFCGLDEMLLSIDDMCEATGFPMLDTQRRFFSNCGKRKLPVPTGVVSNIWRECSPYEWLGSPNSVTESPASGEKNEIFLIHVICRQHASMQGLVVRRKKNAEKLYFRSALELLRMMSAVLPAGSGN